MSRLQSAAVAVRSRNATEGAILAAAREVLADTPFQSLTMDAIAKRAFVSRTAVYFYFPNKQAVVDRLIQDAFTDMFGAAAPYLEGPPASPDPPEPADPRADLRAALAQVVKVVDRDSHLLQLAATLSGEEDRLPPAWGAYVARFFDATEARIRRDQARGIAPTDIPARLAAQALLAMVERHVTLELIVGKGNAAKSVVVLAELWYRAVYSGAPAAD